MINSKVKINPKDKRLARIIAIQAIYAYEIYPETSDDIFNIILNNDDESDWAPLESTPSNDAIDYGKKLYKMVIKTKDELDQLIQERSKNWSINRITLLDRLILRMSLAEMIYEKDVPPKVSISEGVEIAKYFSTDESGSFVNGILDSVYNDIIKDKE
tara:strand:+ start:53 stop:526 length:474 start_codon:yes stop_codon:yes gene_type:complete